MKKLNYSAQQEIIDLLKKTLEHKRKFKKTYLEIVIGNDVINIASFLEFCEKLEDNLIFTFLEKTNQYIFEAIFYSSIQYNEKRLTYNFNQFLGEIFESHEGSIENIVLSSDYSDKDKTILSFVCSDYKKYYHYFMNVYNALEKIFENTLRKQYDMIIGKYKEVNIKNIFLTEVVNKAEYLIICISDYKNIRFHEESNTVLYGISNLLPQNDNKDNDIETLKIICDATKYAILQELSIKNCYQRELASKLNLTTATIAHHISILLEKNIITSRIEKNKVFFSINYEKIKSILHTFNEGIFL